MNPSPHVLFRRLEPLASRRATSIGSKQYAGPATSTLRRGTTMVGVTNRTTILVSVGLLCIACSKPAEQIIGTWAVDSSSPWYAEHSGLVRPNMLGYEFRPDKTFTMDTQEGTYELNGSSVTMHVTTLLGRKLAKPLKATQLNISDDGKMLSNVAGNLRFVKVK